MHDIVYCYELLWHRKLVVSSLTSLPTAVLVTARNLIWAARETGVKPWRGYEQRGAAARPEHLSASPCPARAIVTVEILVDRLCDSPLEEARHLMQVEDGGTGRRRAQKLGTYIWTSSS